MFAITKDDTMPPPEHEEGYEKPFDISEEVPGQVNASMDQEHDRRLPDDVSKCIEYPVCQDDASTGYLYSKRSDSLIGEQLMHIQRLDRTETAPSSTLGDAEEPHINGLYDMSHEYGRGASTSVFTPGVSQSLYNDQPFVASITTTVSEGLNAIKEELALASVVTENGTKSDVNRALTSCGPNDEGLAARVKELPWLAALQMVQAQYLTEQSKSGQERHTDQDLACLQGGPPKKRARLAASEQHRNIDPPKDEEDILGDWWQEYFAEIDDTGEALQEEFRREAEQFHKRRKLQEIPLADEMRFIRLSHREKSRRNKIALDWHHQRAADSFIPTRDATMNDSSTLFVPADHEDNATSFNSSAEVVLIEETNNDVMLDIDDLESETLTAARTTIKKHYSARGHQTSKKGSRRPTAGITKPQRRNVARRGPVMTDLASLVTSNPINDAQALEDGERDEDRLRMTARDKRKALRGLIASLPKEHQDFAQGDRIALEKAAGSSFNGHGACKVAEDKNGWLIKGMKTALRHFQMLGAAFMRDRENSDIAPQGGLVADEMGLGKTVMMLANIVNGFPPANTQHACCATLIVVPSTLLNQWREEIDAHTDHARFGDVLSYGAFKKRGIQTLNDKQVLSRAFIVLCTPYDVMQSSPKVKFPDHLQSEQDRTTWFDQNRASLRGILHEIHWLRVVVDEAHIIKNHLSHTSLAVRELSATFRWAMTGTPVQNSLQELYPYFKFLGVPYTGNFSIFSKNYNSKTMTGWRRLASVLQSFLLRRTYNSCLLGQAIVKLPPMSTTEIWVDFNPIERFIYDLLFHRLRETVKNSAKDGTLVMKHRHYLTMLLRLRQACSHLLLVEQSMRDVFTRADIRMLQNLCDQCPNQPDQRDRESLIELRKMLKNHEKWKEATDDASETTIGNAGSHVITTNTTGEAYGLCYNFNNLLQELKRGSRHGELREALQCAKCGVYPAVDAKLTSCQHVYCATCLQHMMAMACIAIGAPSKCIKCGHDFGTIVPYSTENATESQDDSEQQSSASPRRCSERDRKSSVDLIVNRRDLVMLPSAKTRSTKSQILNWLEVDQNVKVILYTQFLPNVSHLLHMCESEGWPCLRFTGELSIQARITALKKFQTCEGPCVLVATLRTGGVGLNLTSGTRVMILDPWWNDSQELQAFGRVFRIGQTQKTSLTRVFVRGTIDEKIYKMQEKKKAMIARVMGQNADANQNPTLEDLMKLFGLDEYEEAGTTKNDFIMAKDNTCHSRTIFEDGAYRIWAAKDGKKKKPKDVKKKKQNDFTNTRR